MHPFKKKMQVGIIRFPGSNCDFDTLNFFKKFGHKSRFIWHKDTKLPHIDLLVLPGGFAFGDRFYKKATDKYIIDPGAMAMRSPAMQIVRLATKRKLPILGICNGFQILVKARLLPGKLVRNDSGKFFCDYVKCKIVDNSFFQDEALQNKTFVVPVAHGYGKYLIDKKELQALEKSRQIFLKYKDFNPNGSVNNIAGVSNKDGNIFGMMPHPERSPDGKYFMRAMEKYVRK